MARVAAAPARRKASPVRERTFSFRYVASFGRDRVVRGTINAPSEVAAQRLLADKGFTPISLEVVPSQFSLEGMFPSFFSVKPREVITFSRQLATLLESGITLLPAIQLLGSQASTSGPFRRVVATIAQDLGVGKALSQAIARHPQAFDEIYSRTIAVGERTGKLESVLRELSDHMERQGAFARKVSGALTYPIIVMVVATIVGGILMTVALPPLVGMFTTLKVELPLPTRILIFVSGFMVEFKVYLAALLLGGFLTLVWATKQPQGRRALDRLKLKLPVIGPPAHQVELARTCRTMAVMLGAGLSLQEVIDVMPQTTSNTLFQDALHTVRRGLLLGQGLSYPMSLHSIFPSLMLQMVRVGEESNTLETNLRVLADFYERGAEEQTATLVSLIQPLTTVGLAVVAGFIALSVIMPMYSITSAF